MYSPDNDARPQFRIVLSHSFAVNQLWPNNVTNSISHEHCSRHDRLFGSSRNVAGADSDDQTDHRSKETSERIASDRCSWVVTPLGFPNHDTACHDRQTAGNEHWDPGVWDYGGDVSTQRNEDETDTAHGKLEQDGVQGIIAEGRDNQRSKPRDGSVDSVTRSQ